jgi:hypothetical protein
MMRVLLEWGNDIISWDELVTVARQHLRLVSITCGKCKFGGSCVALIVQ